MVRYLPYTRLTTAPGAGTHEFGVATDTPTPWFHKCRRSARAAGVLAFAIALTVLVVLGAAAAGDAWHGAMHSGGAGSRRGPRVTMLAKDSSPVAGKCETPQEGSRCARDVEYAMSQIKKHPDWYVGLHESSDPKAFQMFLHHQRVSGGKRRCPAPCGVSTKFHIERVYGKCHDSTPGENCYNHVIYTMTENLPKYPEWYPGLEEDASFKMVQAYLHKQNVCPEPCHLEEELRKAKKRKEAGDEDEEEEEEEEDLDDMPCHNAQAGEPCFGDVTFAMDQLQKGVHSDWYNGKLDAHSSFFEVQAFLHSQQTEDAAQLCPRPCNKEAVENITKKGSESCHTASKGDECWKAVVWVVETGIHEKPEWYEDMNISVSSTFEHVQNRLSREKNEDRACRAPACPCVAVKKGDDCYEAVMWVMTVGIKNHSDWYKGLTSKSSFEQVQLRLHQDKHTKCGLPCVWAPWWARPETEETEETEVAMKRKRLLL